MNDHAQQPIEWTSDSPSQTVALGRALADLIEPGDVIGLAGPLGAGKTQLVRGLAASLGVDEHDVSSPTFTLMCEYPGRIPIVHIDAYRMESLSDLESIGWSEEMWRGAATVVEWADRIADHLPSDHLYIQLDHADTDRREITLEPYGIWASRRQTLRRIVEEDMGGAGSGQTHNCSICGRPTAKSAKAFPFCSERCRLVDLNR